MSISSRYSPINIAQVFDDLEAFYSAEHPTDELSYDSFYQSTLAPHGSEVLLSDLEFEAGASDHNVAPETEDSSSDLQLFDEEKVFYSLFPELGDLSYYRAPEDIQKQMAPAANDSIENIPSPSAPATPRVTDKAPGTSEGAPSLSQGNIAHDKPFKVISYKDAKDSGMKFSKLSEMTTANFEAMFNHFNPRILVRAKDIQEYALKHFKHLIRIERIYDCFTQKLKVYVIRKSEKLSTAQIGEVRKAYLDKDPSLLSSHLKKIYNKVVDVRINKVKCNRRLNKKHIAYIEKTYGKQIKITPEELKQKLKVDLKIEISRTRTLVNHLRASGLTFKSK